MSCGDCSCCREYRAAFHALQETLYDERGAHRSELGARDEEISSLRAMNYRQYETIKKLTVGRGDCE